MGCRLLRRFVENGIVAFSQVVAALAHGYSPWSPWIGSATGIRYYDVGVDRSGVTPDWERHSRGTTQAPGTTGGYVATSLIGTVPPMHDGSGGFQASGMDSRAIL